MPPTPLKILQIGKNKLVLDETYTEILHDGALLEKLVGLVGLVGVKQSRRKTLTMDITLC